ncbi:methyltransferase domain-containing protein [Halioglobus maricola]|uniref:Methyltransferase domain-containing protein n=2 Tax=Halioglobus maricola TaxID=2601894 RepID=A0A5P9NQP6_9GAMM|nr:methyltransferase domain-containing protein [Halioglobus maricola]
MRTREAALDYPKGSLELAVCHACGFITNLAFERGRHEYSHDCEESQGCSPTFSRWLQELAAQLVENHDIRHKTVLEIGSGKGEFLEAICRAGDNRGFGYDPAYVRGRHDSQTTGSLDFIPEFWDASKGIHDAEFIACRHTLEHIPDVADFLAQLREAIASRIDTLVFFEVPDVMRVLKECAFWDIYYEHCSYFSTRSLERLFQRNGFDVLECALDYDDQYIMLLARPIASPPVAATDPALELAASDHYRDHWAKNSIHWQAFLQQRLEREQAVVLWGGGSKAVAFLTRIQGSAAIKTVVDINPHKQGAYMPGTGQLVIAPGELKENPPHTVIVVNPIYHGEIEAMLSELGLQPEIVCLQG